VIRAVHIEIQKRLLDLLKKIVIDFAAGNDAVRR